MGLLLELSFYRFAASKIKHCPCRPTLSQRPWAHTPSAELQETGKQASANWGYRSLI
jgi:hypothetical protein